MAQKKEACASLASIVTLGLVVYPLFSLVNAAFYKIRIIKGELSVESVAPFANFYRVFSDTLFQTSAEVTIIFSLVSVIIQIPLGLLLAIAVANSRLKRLWISLFIISIILPPVSVALIWRFLVYPEIGLMDRLTSLLGFRIPWLGSMFWARVLIIMVDTWHWTSFAFLIIYAGYVSLSSVPFEAARIDGASDIQTFRHITLPLLRPTIVVALFFRIIDVLQAFPEIWELTFGGPMYATTILNILVYIATFTLTDFSYAAVVALTLMLLTIGFVLTFNKMLKR